MLVPIRPRNGEISDVRLLGIVLGVAVGLGSAGLRARVFAAYSRHGEGCGRGGVATMSDGRTLWQAPRARGVLAARAAAPRSLKRVRRTNVGGGLTSERGERCRVVQGRKSEDGRRLRAVIYKLWHGTAGRAGVNNGLYRDWPCGRLAGKNSRA